MFQPLPSLDPSGPVLRCDGEDGDQVFTKEPDSELAYLLEHVDLEHVDDYALVEVVRAWRRMEAWAVAGAARAAAELAGRDSMNPPWPRAAHITRTNVTGDELAMRLGCSRLSARRLVRDGRAFEGALAPTGDALARGEIDSHKARILVERLVEIPIETALDVQDRLLPGAGRRTPTQLARDVERAVIVIDPEGAQESEAAAVTRRRVNHPRTLADGMAGIWAYLPAADAAQVDAALDALARTARVGGDVRSLDQLRADLLVDLASGTIPGTAANTILSSRAGEPDPPPGPAEQTSSKTRRLVRLFRPADPAGRHRRSSKAQPVCVPPLSRRTQIHVTVSLDTLIGDNDDPAELAGYGPITATTARALARNGTWRRIVTDPLTGRVLDVGRTRYRPPPDIAEHVRARDHTCARPGCPADAAGCELDHNTGRHEGGPTAAHNLAPLCHRDHQIKTTGGYQLRQLQPGVFEWRTPTGHRYRVEPGVDKPYEHIPRPPANDDEPPF